MSFKPIGPQRQLPFVPNYIAIKVLIGPLLVLFASRARAAWQLNLQDPATETARGAYVLHTGMMWLVTIIFFAVFGVLGWALYAHRQSRGYKPAQFHENIKVEILWTVVPFAILVVVAVPATTSLVAMRDTSLPDMTIKATGSQWLWGYEYLSGEGAGVKFMSVLATTQDQIYGLELKGEHYLLEVDKPLVVPVHKKIRVLTTSADVIHDWSVPAFAVKMDAVPGFVRETWFRAEKEGVYRGQCSELCGRDHGFMPVVVQVLSGQDYTAWVAAQTLQTTPPNTVTPDSERAVPDKATVLAKWQMNR